MRLSQRLGITPVRSQIQGRSLDAATRNRLWSVFANTVPAMGNTVQFRTTWMKQFFGHIWSDFFKEPVDDMPFHEAESRNVVKGVFLDGEWWEVYDLLEFAIHSPQNGNRDRLRQDVSTVLSEELGSV